LSTQSERIVGFVASLMPLYMGQNINDCWCAVSLIDGTVIAPMTKTHGDDEAYDRDDGDGDEEDCVVVYWQGDRSRRTEVQGSLIAGQALLRYIELRGIGRTADELRRERDGMAEHFAFKTGASLYLAEGYEEPELQRMLRKAVSKFGPAFVTAAIRRTFGL
jgi:hypothetical protein